jgi:hypothetical protein
MVSDSDEMGSSTQVSAVRCACVPTVLSYHARYSMPLSPQDLAPVALPVLKARVWLPGGPGSFHTGLRGGSMLDSQVVKSSMSAFAVMRWRIGMGRSWI